MRIAKVAAVMVALAGSLQWVNANAEPNLHEFVTPLTDFSAHIKVIRSDQSQLAKIGKDFGMLYRFHNLTVHYKEPNRIRIEGQVGGASGVYIMNGTTQRVAIGFIHTMRNFGDEPGKQKSLLDVGLISNFYLTYTNARFIRQGMLNGRPVDIFDVTYRDRSDTAHHILYVDPKTKVILKHEAYSQEGKLQAIYYFKDIKEVASGIWFPTRIEVRNAEDAVAAITEYKNIKVNIPMPDSLFKV
ncbi:MAG: outer membrane lipoprotein-sorting protein [Armatimonadetes bacterium]|nr:outer membrane lipoprotein-sorting protein [Armatimonadota bacterium]